MLGIYTFFKTIEAIVCAFLMSVGCLLVHFTIAIIVFVVFENELCLINFLIDLELLFTIYFVVYAVYIALDDEFYESDFDI